MRSGQFLTAGQQDTPLPVGSLIKLLAAQTAYAAGDPVKTVIAPAGLIVDPEESQIGIREGQELSRDLLVRAMLIVSANDAARLLALDIAGGEAGPACGEFIAKLGAARRFGRQSRIEQRIEQRRRLRQRPASAPSVSAPRRGTAASMTTEKERQERSS